VPRLFIVCEQVTGPISDANEGHEQRQPPDSTSENPCRGRFTVETRHQHRLEIQREQGSRKRKQETSGFLLGRESIEYKPSED